MKTSLIPLALLAACGLVQAQEVGQVISRTPVYQQVAVPRQSCQQTQPAAPPSTGGGALVGAVVGGLIGSALGGDGSRGATAMAGVIGGSILGDKAESNANSQPVTTCTTQTALENRLVGYNVVYEYAGKQYTVQLPQDPGPTIALQISPVGAAPAAGTVITQPTTVVTTPPAVIYAPQPVYRYGWPVSTSINLGWGWYGGPRYGHHWR